MTKDEIERVEKIVNEQIARDLPVTMTMMKLEDARASGARALFGEKYEETVKVYTIGDFSKEVCGGPHVERTGLLGTFKIQKEQSSSAGVRRILGRAGIEGSPSRAAGRFAAAARSAAILHAMKRMLFVILAMAFSTNLPSPLFPLDQAAYGLTTAAITILFAMTLVVSSPCSSSEARSQSGSAPSRSRWEGLHRHHLFPPVHARAGACPPVCRPGARRPWRGRFSRHEQYAPLAMTTAARRDRVMGLSSTLNLFGFGLGPAVGGIWQRGLPGYPTRVPFAILAAVLAAALLTLLSISAGWERASAPTRPAIRSGIPRQRPNVVLGGRGAGRVHRFCVRGASRLRFSPALVCSMFGTAGRGFAALVFLMTTVGALVQFVQAPGRCSSSLCTWGFIMLGVGSWVMVLGESTSQVLLVLAASLLQGAGNGLGIPGEHPARQ